MTVIDKIMDEYEAKRYEARRVRDEYVSEIFEKYPEIKNIEDEINECGIKSTKEIMSNPLNGDKIISKMEKEMKVLTKKRSEILKSAGVSEDYNKIKYNCSKCSDTGYIETEKCECLKRKLREAGYEKSNLGNLIKTQNFDTFSFEYYSKEKGKSKFSPYELIKISYDEAKKFCEDLLSSKSLMFYGATGLGKTFLSSCIAKEIIDKGYDVRFMSASKLFSVYDDYKFGRGVEEENKDIIDSAYICDLLIIDDLGTEFLTSNSLSFFYDILNDRIINNKKIIISTNLSIEELNAKYTPRFLSRLYESFKTLKFEGENIRKIIK